MKEWKGKINEMFAESVMKKTATDKAAVKKPT